MGNLTFMRKFTSLRLRFLKAMVVYELKQCHSDRNTASLLAVIQIIRLTISFAIMA